MPTSASTLLPMALRLIDGGALIFTLHAPSAHTIETAANPYRSLQLVVNQARLRDGTRRITHVTEVVGMEGDVITLQDIFLFDFKAGIDADEGRYLGTIKPTGLRPKFIDSLEEKGISVPSSLFAPVLREVTG